MTEPGDVLGQRYELRRLLGTGGMGSVWEAFDQRLHRTVAVKRLHPQPWQNQAEREESTGRAMREARITARLDHPNAVPVYDVVEDAGMPCLVMKFVVAEPLSTVLEREGALPVSRVADLGAQLASALQAAHKVGIVHRDVKPGNVLITADGTAQITDFGIAHAMGDVTLTSTGLVTGTPAYLAPEVARGDRSGFPADVFSLGATLYTAVEGRPPFGSDANRMALLHRVASGAYTPPERSGELTSLLLRMLAVNPNDRPVMRDVAARLAQLRDAAAAQARGQQQPAPATETTRPASTVALPPRPGERPRRAPTSRPAAAVPAATVPAAAVPAAAVPAAAVPAADTTRPAPTPRPAAAMPGPATRPSAPPEAEPGPVRDRRRGWFVVAGAAVVLLALLALVLRPDSTPPSATSSTSSPSTRPAPTTSATTSSTTTSATTTRRATPSASRTTTPAATASSSPPVARLPSPQSTPTNGGVRVSGSPTAAELTRAISSYYALLPQDTDRAWPLMTTGYQLNHAGGRASYERFWNLFSNVTTSNVRVVAPSTVEAMLTYTTTSGGTIRELTSYGLVEDGGILKIASSRVLSSS